MEWDLSVGVIYKIILVPALVFAVFACCAICSAADTETREFRNFALDLNEQFRNLGWSDLSIDGVNWMYYRKSSRSRPLIFASFGEGFRNTTVILGGVHGDESPSVYVVFKLAQFLKANPDLYKDKAIIVAPLVNPDGFFSKPRKRTNARGVDINRNMPTKDWIRTKKGRYYSGPSANSENETRFVIALINRYKPAKIISVHSPLCSYDYDGPSSDLGDIVIWLKKISRNNNMPLRRYNVFPGSLGNFAGVERKIHTLTLELPSSAPQHGPKYFEQFRQTLLELLDQAHSEK